KTAPKLIEIRINGQKPGLYSGNLIVDDEYSASIPLLLDVKPPMAQPLIVVIDGIAASIAIWKFVKYLNDKLKIMNTVPSTAISKKDKRGNVKTDQSGNNQI